MSRENILHSINYLHRNLLMYGSWPTEHRENIVASATRSPRRHKMAHHFFIRFWYLRCCGCPRNRGRQHLATSLKTCQNIEAGFLTGWLLCLSPNSEVTASETPPFPHLGCVPAVVPAKGGSSD